jgi:kinesin family protein 5
MKKGATGGSSQGGTNVRVVCRVRPLNSKEQALLENAKYDAKGNKIRETCTEFNPADKTAITVYTQAEKLDKSSSDPYDKHTFNFDYVFDTSTDQKTTYEIAGKPLVESVLEGFNGTILTYGQTSSGKTFTMQGDLDSENFKGIIPRMVDTVFEKIEQSSESMEFTVKASMLEIYNEKIRDLLDPSKNNLNVREEKQKGIYVDGLSEKPIGSQQEVHEIMKEGNDNRAVGCTNMNAQSSRSHSIFYMSITMNDLENCSCKTGKLYLVDLAGSEMISKTGAKGQTLEEAKGINKSLTMLGRVINALTDGKSQYIPYRDSKLTRILQEALGGNSRTCLIITASPSMYNAVETLSTCRFGMRAKSIKNNAKINKQLTVEELKLIVAKLEKTLVIKGNRIQQLEGFIISLGGTIPPDDESFKAIEDTSTSEESNISPCLELDPTKVNTEQVVEGEVLLVGNKREEEEKRIIIMGDQVDQQKSKEKVFDLENEKRDISNDMDTLFAQLKKERDIIKSKDKKISELKEQVKLIETQDEKHKKENAALMKLILNLKKAATSKVATPTASPSNTSSQLNPPNDSTLFYKLLTDTNIESKVKEYIKSIAEGIEIPDAKKDEVNKTRGYTDVEVKKMVEEVVSSVKKQHDEEKKALNNKIEQLKKSVEELNVQNKKQKEIYRILEGIGGTVFLLQQVE